jgi:L-fuculose-phosphate aldolase
MKRVISVRDVQDFLRQGGDLAALTEGALITPAARDLLAQHALSASRQAQGSPAARAPARANTRGTGSVERLFASAEAESGKRQICDIGRRLWERAYVDGNGGNISLRLTDELVLCTPTLVSKGYMKPEDICLVDLEGNQKAGQRKRTSEILMHLEIMKAQPKAKACVHAHPPYATGFAVAGVKPPNCMIPELEVFVGEIPIAPYFTPGTKEMGQHVAALADTHNTILMANHGVVAWGTSVEDAYFKIEIIESYCRTVLVAAQLGKPPNTFTNDELRQLLQIKQNLDIPDRRIGLKECELCDAEDWRPGVTCVATHSAPSHTGPDPEAEALVSRITDLIMERLGR